MSKTTKIVLGVVVIVVIVFLATMSGKNGDTGPIKIGYITPLSGDAASLGEFLKNTTEIALDEINSNGGVNGRKIELVYEDDQCLPAKALTAVKKLIDIDKVKIIIAESCSGAVSAMLPATNEAKIFVFSSSATTPSLNNISSLFARTISSDDSQGKALADYALEKGWKRVGEIQESTDYALGVHTSFSDTYVKSGGQLTREQFNDSVSDLRSVVTKLLVDNPDALLLNPQTPSSAQRVLSAVSQLKNKKPLIVNDLLTGDSKFIEENKIILEGAVVAEQSPDLNNQKYIKFEEKYKKKFNKEVIYKVYAQAQYDLMYILADGLTKFGEDQFKISEWVRTIKDYDGASGKLSIGSDGNRIGGRTLKMVKDGKLSEVK